MNQSFKKYMPFAVIGFVAFVLGLLLGGMLPGGMGGLTGTAGISAAQLGCDASTLTNMVPNGLVTTELLFLRAGPGRDYAPITLLEGCKQLTLTGRSADYAWLQVSLPGNVGGWVFSGYVKTLYNINSLKVTTGAGGALTSAPTASSPTGSTTGSQRNASVLIDANQVAVFIKGMPANADLSATLAPAGESAGKSLVIASGRTDAQGNLTLTFTMPTAWADGSALASGAMTLTMVAGGVTLVANITYYVY